MTRRELLSMLFSVGALKCTGFPQAQDAKPKSTPIFRVKPLAGVDFVLRNSPTPRKYLIETMPGGVALLDYNNDGLLDLFFVNGGHIPSGTSAPRSFSRRDPAYWNRLYRQNPDRTFTDVTREAGLADAGDYNFGMGVAVGDYDNDNDGKLDLFVTRYLDWSLKTSKTCGAEKPTYCKPGEFPPTTNILYRN